MANFRNFKDMKLALEEDTTELNDGMAADGTIEIDEVITMEEVAEELTELTSEIESGNDVIEDSIEVAENLETQVEGNTQLIEESPEEITEDIVVASQEHFIANLGKLHYDLSDITRVHVSMEESVSPVVKLKLSTENITDALAVIWENIKQFFARIGAAIRKYMQKAQIYFNGTAKKASALAKTLANVNEFKISEETANKANDKLGEFSKFISAAPTSIAMLLERQMNESGRAYDEIVKNYVTNGTYKKQYPLKPLPNNVTLDLSSLENGETLIFFTVTRKGGRVYTTTEDGVIKIQSLDLKGGTDGLNEGAVFKGANIIKELNSIEKSAKNLTSVAQKLETKRQSAYKVLEGLSKKQIPNAWKADSGDETVTALRTKMSAGNKLANNLSFDYISSVLSNLSTLMGYYNIICRDAKQNA